MRERAQEENGMRHMEKSLGRVGERKRNGDRERTCSIIQKGNILVLLRFLGSTVVKNHLPMQKTQEIQVQSLGQEDLLE